MKSTSTRLPEVAARRAISSLFDAAWWIHEVGNLKMERVLLDEAKRIAKENDMYAFYAKQRKYYTPG